MTDKELEKLFREKLGDQPHNYNPDNWDRMASALDKADAPLDDLFKKKLDTAAYPYNPSNWEKMMALLNGTGASRGGAYYWRAAAAILLFGLLAGGALVFSGLNTNIPNENRVVNFDENAPNVLEEADPKLEENTLSNKVKPAKIDVYRADENLAVQSDGEEMVVPQKVDDLETDNTQVVAVGSEIPVANSDGITKSNQSDSEGNSSNEEQSSAIAENSSTDKVSNNVATPADNSGKPENIVTEEPSNENVTFAENEGPIVISEKNGWEPVSKNLISSSSKAPILASYQNISEPKAPKKFYRRHNLFFEAGTVLRGSYSRNTVGVGWQGGLGYQFRISQKWAASAGISYALHNDVGILQESDSTFYNFGIEEIETDNESRSFEYIEVPIEICFSPTPRHQFSLGGYFAQLISVKQEIEKRHFAAKRTVETSFQEVEGYNPDFSRYDYGLTVGYRFALNPRLSAGVRLHQGLQDVTTGDDTSLEWRKHHKNFNTRISLRWLLF